MIASYYSSLFFGLAVWLFIACWFLREAHRYKKCRNSIPLRIHVNGIRGKSSVTRLIAAGLRAGQIRTVAKTTGTAAMLIEPDGNEKPLVRHGPANIRELIPVVNYASSVNAQALVAECMALQPELQWFFEHRLLASHIGVITNIRADHEDVMGNGLDSITACLANTLPSNGILVTGQKEFQLLKAADCLTPGTNVCQADFSLFAPECFSGFPYEVFPQNVALALTVCQLAGVDQETALAGMRQASPDPGNLTIRTLRIPSGEIRFINGLAANDPDSTSLLFHQYAEPDSGSLIIWLHGRSDRKQRSVQLCKMLAALHTGLFIISGDIFFLRKKLQQYEVDPSRIIQYRNDRNLTEDLSRLPQPVTIFAAGNIHGFPSAFIA